MDKAAIASLSIIPAQVQHAIVLLHGYGLTGQSIFKRLAKPLAQNFPDSYIVAPDAPYPCKDFPGGHDWMQFDDDWEPEYIVEKLRAAREFLDGFINNILASYHLAENNLALVGFSQGARVALHVALRREKPCAGVLAYSGGISQPQLLREEIRSKPPVCLVHGDSEDIFHADQHINAVRMLQMLEVPVTERKCPGLAHRINEEGIAAGVEFLRGVIG